MRKLTIAVVASLFTLMQGAQAFAASVDEARNFVDKVGSSALAIIADKNNKEQKQAKLESLFSSSIDIPWVGRFVLGRHWRQAEEVQKKRYLREYESFWVTHYASRFADYTGGQYKITGASQDDDGQYLVSMTITSNDGKEIAVDYRVHETDAKQLKVFDVIVEGVSMITTQRSEFASVVGNKGLDYLIDQLANRTLEVSDAKKAS